MNPKCSVAATIVSILVASALSPVASAEEQPAEKSDLEEIVVTAEKREVGVKDIPISIYAASGKSLENSGITTVQGLTQLAPSLQFAKSTNTF